MGWGLLAEQMGKTSRWMVGLVNLSTRKDRKGFCTMNRTYLESPRKTAFRGIWTVSIALVLCSTFGLSSLYADTIELTNGLKFEGKIIQETDHRVQMELETSGGRLWFPRSAVKSMKKIEKRPLVRLPDEEEKARERRKAQQLLQKMQSGRTPPAGVAQSQKQQEEQQEDVETVQKDQVEALIEQLNDPEWSVAYQAVKELGELKDERAVPVLIHTLRDNRTFVQRGAIDALRKITGQNFGFNPKSSLKAQESVIDLWLKWWEKRQKEQAKAKAKAK